MKIALMEVYGQEVVRPETAIDAHLRNAMEIHQYLGAGKCDLLLTESHYNNSHAVKYDAIVLCYTSFYAPFNAIKRFVANNPDARKFVLSNEYNKALSLGYFRPFEAICNFEIEKPSKSVSKFHFLNLNLLLARKPNPLTEKKYDCIYYGTFRPNRAEYFREYLQKGIYVSTSEKNFKKYQHAGARPTYIRKLKWEPKKETLNHFRYSLYIEDDFTHTCFNNLANRYYEAGFCNNVIFFDRNCVNTIRKSELNPFFEEVKFYMVSSYQELQEKIQECNKDFKKHLEAQKTWHKEEPRLKNEMLLDLERILLGEK